MRSTRCSGHVAWNDSRFQFYSTYLALKNSNGSFHNESSFSIRFYDILVQNVIHA